MRSIMNVRMLRYAISSSAWRFARACFNACWVFVVTGCLGSFAENQPEPSEQKKEKRREMRHEHEKKGDREAKNMKKDIYIYIYSVNIYIYETNRSKVRSPRTPRYCTLSKCCRSHQTSDLFAVNTFRPDVPKKGKEYWIRQRSKRAKTTSEINPWLYQGVLPSRIQD